MSKPRESGDGARPQGDWRDKTRFKQGERYSGADRTRADAPQDPPSLKPVFLAGGAMVVVTILMRLVGAGALLAFLAGGAVFIVALLMQYERRDPKPTKRTVAKGTGYDAEAVAARLQAAETDLTAIDKAARDLPSSVARALDEMTASARRVLDTIAKDPLDLDRARKFLVAYLPSARRAVEKYVALGVRDKELDARFLALVEEMSDTCRRQEETLRSDDVFDLEIEIETLSERLQGAK